MPVRVWDEMQLDSYASRTVEAIFNALGMTQEYETALNMITKKKSIGLQKEPCEIWTKHYNPCLLRFLDASMGFQFVLDPISCIIYLMLYVKVREGKGHVA